MHHDVFYQHQQNNLEILWNKQLAWVEAPNNGRGGVSGVARLTLEKDNQQYVYYVKKQHNHLCRETRQPWRFEPTFVREHRNFKVCEQLGVPVPQLIYFATDKKRRSVLVTAELTGYHSLDTLMTQIAHTEQMAIMEQLGTFLHKLYRAKYRHGSLYGKHIFVRPTTHQIALIDLEKMRPCLMRSSLYRDLRQLFRRTPQMTYQHIDCLIRSAGMPRKMLSHLVK